MGMVFTLLGGFVLLSYIPGEKATGFYLWKNFKKR
jgi:hypothetical protein